MKVFAAILFIAVAVAALEVSEEQKKKLQAVAAQCVQSSGVEKEVIAKMRQGDFQNDAKLKKYLNCMFTSLKMLNDKGELDIDVVKSRVPPSANPEKTKAVIADCKAKEKVDKESRAFEIYKCFATHASPIKFW